MDGHGRGEWGEEADGGADPERPKGTREGSGAGRCGVWELERAEEPEGGTSRGKCRGPRASGGG